MDLGELGARIKKRREARGLKQADLASALRVTPQAVSKWERGENAPTSWCWCRCHDCST